MNISNAYKSRHGFADFETKIFKITNGKDDTTIDCELLKVPTYSYTHKYRENICEGNGWYSKGKTITETITHDFYWLIILDNQCIGVIDVNLKSKVSGKHAIRELTGLTHIKEFLKTI